MAVKRRGSIYAVLAAHLQGTRNRMVRELGKFGVIMMAVLVVVLFAAVALPLLGGMVAVGYLFGGRLASPSSVAMLGGILFGLSFFGGAVSGTLGGTKQLTWESFRTYPLRHCALFVAELVAGLGDLVPVALGLAMLALLAGVGVAEPRALPLLPLAWLEGILALLLVQLVVSSLASALVRRMRVALAFLALSVWLGSALAAMIPEAAGHGVDVARVHRLAAVLGRVATFLPTTGSIAALAASAEGRWGAALALHAYPGLLLTALWLLASRLLAREAEPASESAGTGAPARQWTFTTPAAGIARLQWHTLMDSHLGRFGFVLPLVAVALIKGPMAQFGGASPLFAVPAAYAYAALSGNQLQLNQFGLDGHGVKGLLLLPIRAEDILRGKAWGLSLYCAAQVLLLTVLLAIVSGPSPSHLAGGALFAGSVFATQNGVGRWTSAWLPRRLPRRALRSGSASGPAVLVGLGLSIVSYVVFGGVYVLCGGYAPRLLVPVMALLFAACLALHRALRPAAARYVMSRREKILEAMG